MNNYLCIHVYIYKRLHFNSRTCKWPDLKTKYRIYSVPKAIVDLSTSIVIFPNETLTFEIISGFQLGLLLPFYMWRSIYLLFVSLNRYTFLETMHKYQQCNDLYTDPSKVDDELGCSLVNREIKTNFRIYVPHILRKTWEIREALVYIEKKTNGPL